MQRTRKTKTKTGLGAREWGFWLSDGLTLALCKEYHGESKKKNLQRKQVSKWQKLKLQKLTVFCFWFKRHLSVLRQDISDRSWDFRFRSKSLEDSAELGQRCNIATKDTRAVGSSLGMCIALFIWCSTVSLTPYCPFSTEIFLTFSWTTLLYSPLASAGIWIGSLNQITWSLGLCEATAFSLGALGSQDTSEPLLQLSLTLSRGLNPTGTPMHLNFGRHLWTLWPGKCPYEHTRSPRQSYTRAHTHNVT